MNKVKTWMGYRGYYGSYGHLKQRTNYFSWTDEYSTQDPAFIREAVVYEIEPYPYLIEDYEIDIL